MHNPNILPDYTMKDVMRELAVSRDVIQTLVKNGDLRAYRAGKRLRFERREIEDFKRRNAVGGIRVKRETLAKGKTLSSGYIYRLGDRVV